MKHEDIVKVKARGFLRNRGTECFSGRIVAPGTVFTAENFKDLGALAATYGNGRLICTSRLSVEIPGIPFEKIPEAEAFAAAHGLFFGGTGSKVRPIVACKGSTCVFGNADTHAIATRLHDEFYIGWSDVTLPHKFKIGIGGCPNSCMKPSLNDIGFEAHKTPVYDEALCRGCSACAVKNACPMKAVTVDARASIDRDKCISCGVCIGKCLFSAVKQESETRFVVYIGGTWGKTARIGRPLSRLVSEDELSSILRKSLLFFRKYGEKKERFGLCVERIGFDRFESELFSDVLIREKDAILAREL